MNNFKKRICNGYKLLQVEAFEQVSDIENKKRRRSRSDEEY